MIIINERSNYISDEWCESPIEKQFLNEVVKYLEIGVQLWQQMSYDTSLGRFRVDFLIKKGNVEYVIELDGKGYHGDTNDIWRDSFLLGEKKVKSIVRIKGKDIVYSLHECLYFLSNLFPVTFSERGKLNLTTLLESENKETVDRQFENNIYENIDKFYISKIEYENDTKYNYPSIEILVMDQTKFCSWKKYYEFALKNSLFDTEQLNKEYFNK